MQIYSLSTHLPTCCAMFNFLNTNVVITDTSTNKQSVKDGSLLKIERGIRMLYRTI